MESLVVSKGQVGSIFEKSKKVYLKSVEALKGLGCVYRPIVLLLVNKVH